VIIKTKHFEFEKVNFKNLEQLRVLHNSRFVQNYLVHKGEISVERQTEWFKKEDTIHNHYFLSKQNGNVMGYCVLRHIDDKDSSAEPGTFIADQNLLDSSMAALFMISFLDVCRFLFGIKKFYGNVLNTNGRALANYEWFGAVKRKGTVENEIVLTESENQSYEQSTEKIRRALKTIYGYELDITVAINGLIDADASRNLFLSMIEKLPGEMRNKVKLEIVD
jgi:hypothetical protein